MTQSPRNKIAKDVAILSLLSNIVLTILRATVGIFAGSTALLADAANSASDILATVVVYVGLKLAGNPPDKNHHFGHAKFESVAAKIVALMIIATGIASGINSLLTLQRGNLEAPGSLAIWVALFSIVVKESTYRYVLGVGRKITSTVLQADAWHHRSDAITSLAALCGVLGARLGFPAFDPLAGFAVSLLIAYTGVKIYTQSVRELIDEAPPETVIEKITSVAENTDGVLSVTDMKARLIGARVFVDLKICVNPFLTVVDGHQIAGRAKRALLDQVPQVESVIVHVNPCHHMEKATDKTNCAKCKFHPSLPSKEDDQCFNSY